ncbi:NUDIX domain-containing protein [Rhizobium sp. TRM95796]|uniref:NUDIX domain-containing protein n=1 Tax=Rhizobium sp. TRM95796 TaxID=2979862 RepID=UPI0021E8CB18|nr:NUDIX domain-containing protein [Rhizobium sp. TRM95796]MCV3764299.1 NUDIX domain-containing protein [Rhizobium sp. TRM95796]
MRPGEDFPGVGVGLVIIRDARLLLYRRVRPPEAGHWNIVGGKIDHLEAANDAVRREAEEESGLLIGSVEFLGLSEQIFADEGQHWLSLIYRAVEFSGEARVTEPEKLPEFGWFPVDALPQPLSRFAADAVAMLTKAPLR